MKHFKTYLLCLGLALTTASCSQDDFESNDTASDKLVDMSFKAGTAQPVTRTVLGEDGSTVTWQKTTRLVLVTIEHQVIRVYHLRHHQQVVMSSSGDKQQTSIHLIT